MENSNVTPYVPKDKKEKEQASLVSSLVTKRNCFRIGSICSWSK